MQGWGVGNFGIRSRALDTQNQWQEWEPNSLVMGKSQSKRLPPKMGASVFPRTELFGSQKDILEAGSSFRNPDSFSVLSH